MPTGTGRKTLFDSPLGVKAFGTKISGAVLNTFTSTVPVPVQPYCDVAVTIYRTESVSPL